MRQLQACCGKPNTLSMHSVIQHSQAKLTVFAGAQGNARARQNALCVIVWPPFRVTTCVIKPTFYLGLSDSGALVELAELAELANTVT